MTAFGQVMKALGLLLMCIGPAVAKVYRAVDAAQFKRIVHEKADGLPVVVDFYSDGCGPCRMIAPVFQSMSSEYKGRAIFVKVDIARHNVGVQISSMPTFQFYYNGKLRHQFSGADDQGIRYQLQSLTQMAQKDNFEVKKADLEEFYKEHDPSKIEKISEIAEKYAGYKSLKLARKLKKKYGKEPKKSPRPWPRPPKKKAGAAGAGKDIKDFTLDELKAQKDATVNWVYSAEFIKEAKKNHANKKETTDPARRERNFWLFSLAAFTENLLLIWAKASGSETIVRTVTELQEFHTRSWGTR